MSTSSPFGRFKGVVFVTVGMAVAVGAVVFVVALVGGKLPDALESLRGPTIIVRELPRECDVHLGDWVTEYGRRDGGIVWLGTQADMNACAEKFFPGSSEFRDNPEARLRMMDIRIPLRSANEEAPVIGVNEVCDPFYADSVVFDEAASEWVLAFEGDLDDMKTCGDSNYEEAMRSSYSTIEKLKIRGRVIGHPFRFVTATPTP